MIEVKVKWIMKEIKKLVPFLPHGTVNQIANKTGYSRQYVSKVKQGKARNVRITREFLKIAKQYKALLDEINDLTKI